MEKSVGHSFTTAGLEVVAHCIKKGIENFRVGITEYDILFAFLEIDKASVISLVLSGSGESVVIVTFMNRARSIISIGVGDEERPSCRVVVDSSFLACPFVSNCVS